MNPLDRTTESERCLLAAVMADPRTITEASAVVGATNFTHDAHRRLWAMLEAMHEAGESIADRRRLIANVKQSGILDYIGGAAEFAKHYIDAGTVGNVLIYASEVKQHSTRRRLSAIANQFRDDIEVVTDPSELAAEIRALIDDAAADAGNAFDCVHLHAAAKQRLDLLEHPERSDVGRLIGSGIACIDDAYGGFRSGGSYVIAARPGRGKSALLKQIFNSLDMRSKPALAISLEMEPHEFAARMLSERCEIDGKFLEVDESGDCPLQQDEMAQLRQCVADTQHSVIRIAAPKGKAATMEAIAAQARLAKAKWDIEVLALDYLQIMAKSSASQSDYEFVTANSKAFKSLARELGIVVIVLSQLNRGSEQGGKPRRPRLSDLRDSGSIEQDADGVIMLHQIEENKNDYEMIVPKWRNDAEGLFKVQLVGKYTKFVNEPITNHPNYHRDLGMYATDDGSVYEEDSF